MTGDALFSEQQFDFQREKLLAFRWFSSIRGDRSINHTSQHN